MGRPTPLREMARKQAIVAHIRETTTDNGQVLVLVLILRLRYNFEKGKQPDYLELHHIWAAVSCIGNRKRKFPNEHEATLEGSEPLAGG